MSEQNKVSGVVLAGGLARRMGQQDKGLILFKNRPLVSYALQAMTPLVADLYISANRNQEQYRQLGFPVITDNSDCFDGPLAGILAAMQIVHHPVLLIMPCDSPLLTTEHVQRLLAALADDVDIAVAFDGERLHPVFAALKTHLRADLQTYLQAGERKLQAWFKKHQVVEVDFSDRPAVFANINTPEQLVELETANNIKLSGTN
ncbi:molybdenum cofactor guanylyltransferase [Methylomonas lenta]|uniref:Molybdenum cofactor guanylyltransferase n=1 Tax=Methylomonas lenta TaxID=980561 RepID=A0A177NTD1_9GAMM|nr:molybdenum cofactor guanylyltransferase MobA [Methylomonas lenta]OAI21171.1 molybdenum cofactor guanylyltransferase [Methylomonas lenta]